MLGLRTLQPGSPRSPGVGRRASRLSNPSHAASIRRARDDSPPSRAGPPVCSPLAGAVAHAAPPSPTAPPQASRIISSFLATVRRATPSRPAISS